MGEACGSGMVVVAGRAPQLVSDVPAFGLGFWIRLFWVRVPGLRVKV